MHFIKNTSLEDQQELSKQNWRGPRTSYGITYRHDDHADWVAVVDEVQPGETEITEAEYDAITAANYAHNVVFELDEVTRQSEEVDVASDEELLRRGGVDARGMSPARLTDSVALVRSAFYDKLTAHAEEVMNEWAPRKGADVVAEILKSREPGE